MTYTTLPTKASLRPSVFKAHAPDDQLQKFKQLLHLSELGPRTYENTTNDTFFGVTYDWMDKAKTYWETEYDWRKSEDRINSYPNYMVEIEDDSGETYDVHFVALFSTRQDAIPIAFLHGWPGSFLEFLDLLDLVKSQYSTDTELPYHIIVPSLLGYTYSSGPSLTKNTKMEDQARVIDKLMCGLGFSDGYIAQGGDIGSFVARMLASKYPGCKGAHLNMCVMAPPSDVPDGEITEAEKKDLERLQTFTTTGNAYAREHGTRPSTIGFTLSASPLALLAWIAEKFQIWSDPTKTPHLTSILDSVTLYWLTQSFPRGIFPYRNMTVDVHGGPEFRVEAPKALGFSSFAFEIVPVPIAWAKRTGNLVWSKRHERGGHFAAMEVTAELWSDVKEFVENAWEI